MNVSVFISHISGSSLPVSKRISVDALLAEEVNVSIDAA